MGQDHAIYRQRFILSDSESPFFPWMSLICKVGTQSNRPHTTHTW